MVVPATVVRKEGRNVHRLEKGGGLGRAKQRGAATDLGAKSIFFNSHLISSI